MLMPWLLVIFGTFFLLENLGLLPWFNWPTIWPVILILAGLYMMKKRGGHDCCNWFSGKPEEKK